MRSASRRKHERYIYQAPINYSLPPAEASIQTEMGNSSLGGVYFVAQGRLRPGTRVMLKARHQDPCGCERPGVMSCLAEVKWSRQLTHTTPVLFGVGAEYRGVGFVTACNLCGLNFPFGAIQFVEEGACLCGDCRERLSEMPEGKVKACLQDYLSCNWV